MTNESAIIPAIKGKSWELRVKRPGFLQSKHIVSAALTQPIQLTPAYTLKEENNLWVGNINLYNQETVDTLMERVFGEAFGEVPYWPLAILKDLKQTAKDKDAFIESISLITWGNANTREKTEYLDLYVELLTRTQKYYAFAVPLTNYCEQVLKESDVSLLEYGVQYEMLDVDRMGESLLQIKNADVGEQPELIQEHLRRFGWIKSNYNIIEPYTEEEVRTELLSEIHLFQPKPVPEHPYAHLVTALQIGIYLRNSMKEMSQQIWFAHEPFVHQAAENLGTTREDILQLLPEELAMSLESGELTVSSSDLDNRHAGAVIGMLDGNAVLLTGSVVAELTAHFDSPDTAGLSEVKGNVASKGCVTGVARVIANMSEISKLKDGDVLITSMTTPDFVVAMKRASAIVTDEGGLSCHAAIVSRELRKPCVIGTKIATKVFKDGDRVEVDAEKGIVRRL